MSLESFHHFPIHHITHFAFMMLLFGSLNKSKKIKFLRQPKGEYIEINSNNIVSK